MDLSPADWVVERMTTFAENVASIIPEGFEVYGRLAHTTPAGEEPPVGSLPRDQMELLIGVLRSHTATPEDVWFASWSGWGSHRLDPRPGAIGILTSIRWGWGAPKPKPLPRRRHPLPPILELPGRHYYLLHGPIEGALETMMSPGYEGLDPWWQSVNLWWPDDRTWFVSTEIDFAWTYVGGTRRLIDELMAEPRLEVMTVGLDDGIAPDSA